MKEYESKFGFELSKYDSVSTAVNVKLCGNKYMKMSGFKTALANAIASSTRPESTSGGGGGGGSSTSSNKIINAPVVPDRPNILTNFDDLDNVPWAKDSIEKLANKGIVSGKEDRKFFPNDIIKREEFIKIAVSAFGLEDDSAQTSFADVPAGSWVFKYVAAGVKAGLIYGIDENNFGTGLGMTRQDLATIIYRYLTSQGKEIASDTYLFADDDKIADYAHEAVYVLKTQGILSGTENNSFEPQRYATRAEVARVIASLLSL